MQLCECGCGKPTRIAPYSNKNRRWVKGLPIRFIHGHHARLQPKMEKAHRWNGGKVTASDGRVLIKIEGKGKYILRSVMFAEKALGKPLPPKAKVHHFDENPQNDTSNLIVCENRKYHHLLHKRKRAYDNCGKANWRRCKHCKKWDAPQNLSIVCGGRKIYHKKCEAQNTRQRREKGKNKNI